MLISLYFFLLIELVAVSYIDLLTKKISNAWFFLNILVFIFLLVFTSGLYDLNIDTFFYSTVFFAVGLFLFIFRIMGAGDSKYLVSLFILIPVNMQETALMCLLYTTIIIGGSHFIVNSIKNFDKIKEALREKKFDLLKGAYGKKFSFAPVILISWIWFGWKNKNLIF